MHSHITPRNARARTEGRSACRALAGRAARCVSARHVGELWQTGAAGLADHLPVHSYGLYSYGLYSYGLYSYGLYSYGIYGYGPYIYGLYIYGLCRADAEPM